MGVYSCYEEFIIYPEPSSESFNFVMTFEQEELIVNSRGQKHLITDPDPMLFYDDKEYIVDRFQLRGANSLNFRRKSFSVNLDSKLAYYDMNENRERTIEKFKLISMVFDYTYIEEGIAIGIFSKLHLWSLFSFYTEVQLNNNTQGLYLFIEDPEDHFLYQKNAAYILRRDYHNWISDSERNEIIPARTKEYYDDRFNHIYDLILDYSGRELYDSLLNYLDFGEYCRKLAVDMLLKNGDYTDEIFFYTKEKEGKEVFGIAPWDYDDIFAELPHEIGRTWGPGSKFGSRVYYSMDDIYADVGHVLLFSIEDDLDYKIATDSFLYNIYIGELAHLMEMIDNRVISDIVSTVRDQLLPFYERQEIIDQSRYDERPTSMELFEVNLAEKEKFLIDRRTWILQELDQNK